MPLHRIPISFKTTYYGSLQSLAKRFLSNGERTIADFTVRKQGTGSGPFVEIPEFTQLQDSLLVKLPAFSTVYGNLINVCAVNVDSNSKDTSYLTEEYREENDVVKFSTKQFSANIIMSSSIPMSNVQVVKIDNYEKGLVVPDFEDNILCYSGDLVKVDNNEVKGLGVIALSSDGPIHHISLKDNEQIMIIPDSIIAYSSGLQITLTRLMSSSTMLEIIKKAFERFYKLSSKYTGVLMVKWLRDDKLFYNIKGPGYVIIKDKFDSNSRKYSDKQLNEVFK